MKKQGYYDIKPLIDTGASYLMLIGMRSNGKSYAVKKTIIEDALEGKNFVYLRRWSEDIKAASVEAYFDDMPFLEITGGKYTGISAYQGYLYFYNPGEDDKPVREGPAIGRYCALNLYERYKSQVFKDVENIVYEEFLTDKFYLGTTERPEPKLFMQFVSTVARDRNIRVFMVGNTVSRLCPYFSEWGMLKDIMTMKPGTISKYNLRGENGVVKIAVENCEAIQTKSRMFFGTAAKQIVNGEWDVDEVPKLLKPYEYYDMLYEITVVADDFKYIMQLMFDNQTGGPFVYVYPNTKDRKTLRTLTPEFNTDPFITRGFRHDIKAECLIAECIRGGKICYSDNLTGTDFRQVMKKYDFRSVI